MENKKKNLSAYLFEIVTVVIGITIAFALDNYAQIKKHDEEEKLYIEALIADLDKDIQQLEAIRDSSGQVIRLTGEVFNFIYSDAPVSNYTRQHVTSTYSTPYFSSNNGTYLSLINSGDLKILSNFELRQELVTLYRVHYNKVFDADEFIKELVTNRIYPYILKHVAFHPREDRILSEEPLQTNEAINLLGSFFNMMSKRNQDYNELIDHCKRVKGILSSSI